MHYERETQRTDKHCLVNSQAGEQTHVEMLWHLGIQADRQVGEQIDGTFNTQQYQVIAVALELSSGCLHACRYLTGHNRTIT